jgi:hypothetical protein
MAAGDVAAFVRQHADQLVGRLGPHDQAGIDEDPLAARHEGVERVVLDDHDLDRSWGRDRPPFQIGRTMVRMSFSISASRMRLSR